MKRNPLNSIVVALAVPLLVAGLAGCKKKEEPPRPQHTPMPQRPQAAAPATPGPAPQAAAGPKGGAPVPGAPQPGAPQPGAPAQAGLPAKPGAPPIAAIQKQSSSALRPPSQISQLDFRNRTDPFRPYVVETPPQAKTEQAQQAQVRKGGEQLPIQSYDVSKFKVVGIIAGLRENKALIVDPTGKGYVVQAGMPLGSNEGRITRITSSAVEVVETYKEGKGHVKKRKIVLTLAKKR